MHNLLKFIPLLAVVAFTGNAMGTCTSPTTISFGGNQKPAADEFLYETKDDWEKTLSGYTNSGKFNSGEGVAYECDGWNSPSCTGGDIVTLGPNHYFGGKLVTYEKTYKCVTDTLNDHWIETTKPYSSCIIPGTNHSIKVGTCVSDNAGCIEYSKNKCSGLRADSLGTKFHLKCVDENNIQCVAIECVDGYKANNNGKCIKDDDKNECDAGKFGKISVGSFAIDSSTSSYKILTQQDCKKSNFPISDDNGGKFRLDCLSANVLQCTAMDCKKGYHFDSNKKCIKNNTPTPVKPTPKDESFECPNNPELDEWSRKYTDNAEVMSLIKAIRDKCAEKNISQDEYDKLISEIRIIIARIENEAKVNELSKGLSDMQAKFTTSHWTDKEGNFNKKRLLSDSIAATVLGTTGGLITSHVMKKKQAENGFDALQCTVGGQSVATWGDEFTVGIQ